MAWDETDRVLGHVDGTEVQHQKKDIAIGKRRKCFSSWNDE